MEYYAAINLYNFRGEYSMIFKCFHSTLIIKSNYKSMSTV